MSSVTCPASVHRVQIVLYSGAECVRVCLCVCVPKSAVSALL